MLGLCCCTWAFSSCDEQGLLSSCSAWASHCGGFSCCGARALGHAVVSGCGTWAQLPRGIWDLARPGIEPCIPGIGRWILLHCTTREVWEPSSVSPKARYLPCPSLTCQGAVRATEWSFRDPLRLSGTPLQESWSRFRVTDLTIS